MSWRHDVALLVCVAPATLAGPMPSSAVPAATVISVPTRASHDTDLPPRIVDHQQHGEDGPNTTGEDEGPKSRPAVAEAPQLSGAYRFVSAPDFLNQDVADLTAGGREQHSDPDTGRVANSTNPAYERALDHVLSEVGSSGATDLLVAGDLMEGRWGRDDSGAGVFGPVRTNSQRMAAAQEAAAVYYPAWSQRLTEQGLTPYPALGDHEIGDNPWTKPGDPWIRFKRKHVPAFKQLFASELLRKPDGERRFMDRPTGGQARDTAYAVRLDANVLLVTIDPFTRRHGEVRARVDRAQLKWLQDVLRRARRESVPWVMVQGHTPITGPVRYRNSSQLTYQGGTNSALWRTMVKGGVDVYLCGEVHDQTVNFRDGILQVAHGSLFYRGEASYLLGQATAKRLVFENHQFRGRVDFTDRLWTTSRRGAPGSVVYPDGSLVTGTLEARRTASGGIDLESSAGILRPLQRDDGKS